MGSADQPTRPTDNLAPPPPATANPPQGLVGAPADQPPARSALGKIGRVAWRIFARTGTILGATLLVLLLLIVTGFGYGISSTDLRQLDDFCDAVDTWQHDTDFRRVSDQYVYLSHDTLQARMAGISAEEVLMGLRSIPGLPEQYAAGEGSRKHYDDFTAGELSAYLHLCGEQGFGDFMGLVEQMGDKASRNELSDDDCRRFLQSFNLNMSVTVSQDAGAVKSVRRLVADTQASSAHPFVIRDHFVQKLLPVIADFARERGWPTEPQRMTASQQAVALVQLDDHLKKADGEMWRTKQMVDFCNGIWGQTYGLIYKSFLVGIRWAHRDCMFLAPALWLGLGLLVYRRRRKRAAARAGKATGTVPPPSAQASAAVDGGIAWSHGPA